MNSMENKENQETQLPLPGMPPNQRNEDLDAIIVEALTLLIGEVSNLANLPLSSWPLPEEVVDVSLGTLVTVARTLFGSWGMENLTSNIVVLQRMWSYSLLRWWKIFQSRGGVDGYFEPSIRDRNWLSGLVELAEELT